MTDTKALAERIVDALINAGMRSGIWELEQRARAVVQAELNREAQHADV